MKTENDQEFHVQYEFPQLSSFNLCPMILEKYTSLDVPAIFSKFTIKDVPNIREVRDFLRQLDKIIVKITVKELYSNIITDKHEYVLEDRSIFITEDTILHINGKLVK